MALDLSLKDSQTNGISGLNVYFHSCTTTALYAMDVQMIVFPGNSVSVALSHNGSQIAITPAPSSTQNHIEISQRAINCSVNDVLTVTVTSPLASDALPNAVSGIVQIGKQTTSA